MSKHFAYPSGKERIKSACPGLPSVSYTHLDVYKRQPDFFETGKVYYQAKQEMELASKNLRREQDLYAHKVSAQKEVEEAEVLSLIHIFVFFLP